MSRNAFSAIEREQLRSDALRDQAKTERAAGACCESGSALMHTQGEWSVAMIDGGERDDEIATEVNGCLVNIASVFGTGEYTEATIDGKDEPHYMVSEEEAAANGRRIDACVNACAGISTDDLEKFGRFISSGEQPAIIEQRDELMAALEGVLPFLTGEYWPGVVADAAVDRAIAVARKVDAGNTATEAQS